MNGPTRTWNAVVVGKDTPCWSGTRRHERLKACAAQATEVRQPDDDKKPSTATSAAA
jgi:hypothetical protein